MCMRDLCINWWLYFWTLVISVIRSPPRRTNCRSSGNRVGWFSRCPKRKGGNPERDAFLWLPWQWCRCCPGQELPLRILSSCTATPRPFDQSPITIFNKEHHMLEFHLGQAMESKLCGWMQYIKNLPKHISDCKYPTFNHILIWTNVLETFSLS